MTKFTIKSTAAALAFPFVLILMVPIRRYLIPCFFSKQELRYLDQSGAVKEGDDDDEDDVVLTERASGLSSRSGRSNRRVFGAKRRTEIQNAIDAARQENIEHETS